MKKSKCYFFLAGVLVNAMLITGCGASASQLESQLFDAQAQAESYKAMAEQLESELAVVESEKSDIAAQLAKAEHQIDEYKPYKDKYMTLKNAYNTYKEKMAPYEELEAAEAEARKIEAESIAAQEAEEKAARESEEAAAKEAEEKAGYDTGITYDNLARTPDDYEGKLCKFYGRVIQVLEDDGTVEIRLAVNGDYGNVIYGYYKANIVSSRILEDDNITIYGRSEGLITYETIMGGSVTIPLVKIDKIDQ